MAPGTRRAPATCRGAGGLLLPGCGGWGGHLPRVRVLLCSGEGPPDSGTQGGTDHRGHDEEPQLRERRTPFEEGRTDRAGRIDRSARDRDADNVNQHQRQTDGQSGQVSGAVSGIGGAQDHQHENEGKDGFGDKCLQHHPVGKAVGSRGGGAAVAAACDESIENGRADNGADNL